MINLLNKTIEDYSNTKFIILTFSNEEMVKKFFIDNNLDIEVIEWHNDLYILCFPDNDDISNISRNSIVKPRLIEEYLKKNQNLKYVLYIDDTQQNTRDIDIKFILAIKGKDFINKSNKMLL